MKKKEITQGKHFTSAISAIKGTPEEIKENTENASDLLHKIIQNYEEYVGSGYVGADGTGIIDANAKAPAPVGLMYGLIQSGKTRAMILSGALALDNGFRIVVILTSDINRLVGQTHQDFIDGIQTVQIYSKTDIKGDALNTEAAHVAHALEDRDYGVVIVGSKGAVVLRRLIEFLSAIHAEKYPSIIFDDEGDQATLDTNTSRRSSKDPSMPVSTIHGLVHSEVTSSIRTAMPSSVFISVTGTPQGIFLQNTNGGANFFVHLLKAGENYVGGSTFFRDESPDEIPYIKIIDEGENIKLLEPDSQIPEGLQNAICFFIISATAAGLSEKGWDEYKMLCHPSVKQGDHDKVKSFVDRYLSRIIDALRHPETSEAKDIFKRFDEAYADLRSTNPEIKPLSEILSEARSSLLQRKLFVVNAKSTNDQMRYSRQYNFIIGGNTIGRGLAIKSLLVTYYTRTPKHSMADTMYQHARMFGYRRKTLSHTRVFLPRMLYDRFYQIYLSDEEARKYIETHGIGDTGKLLLRTVVPGFGLKPTRPNILDANHVKIIYPGHAIYPNYPKFRKPEILSINTNFERLVTQIAPEFLNQPQGMKEISTQDAQRLVKSIKTSSTNAWSDNQVANFLQSFAFQLKNERVVLRWRPVTRSYSDGGYLGQGILSSQELKEARANGIPTLIVGKMDGTHWDNTNFYYPTIVSPDSLSPFIFNNN